MDIIYSLGFKVVVAVQDIFSSCENLFVIVNEYSNPNNVIHYIFPFVSIFDSVFAADLLLTSSVSLWVNAMMKWILNEDRPYWWVKETKHFKRNSSTPPSLFTNYQTCETGPGCPSGHVMSQTVMLTLFISWILSIRGNDPCKPREKGLSGTLYFFFYVIILITCMARMFVSAHFPHQCLLGVLIGRHVAFNMFDSTSQFLDMDEEYKDRPRVLYTKLLQHNILIHICLALALLVAAIVYYWVMKLLGSDPVYSIKLAFKWCPSAAYLHHSTTPFYVIVMSTGSILGWSLCVTPTIKNYRYCTKDKSYVIAVLTAYMIQQIFYQWQETISRTDASYFYIMNLVAFILRPFFFLRIIPALAMCRNKWQALKTKTDPKSREKKKHN